MYRVGMNKLYSLKRGVFKMPKDVLCEVNNCTYWGEGNRCVADQIYVISHAGKQASDGKETDCKTFKPEKKQ